MIDGFEDWVFTVTCILIGHLGQYSKYSKITLIKVSLKLHSKHTKHDVAYFSPRYFCMQNVDIQK